MRMKFSPRVESDGAGGYRWSYDSREHGNRRPLSMMVKICAAVWAIVAIIMFVIAGGRYLKDALIFAAATCAGTVILPALIWLAMPPVLSFSLTEAHIEAWPKGRSSGIYPFRNVRRVTLRHDRDEIYLHYAVGGLQVLVPPEDYDRVLEYIQDRLPAGTEVQHDW